MPKLIVDKETVIAENIMKGEIRTSFLVLAIFSDRL